MRKIIMLAIAVASALVATLFVAVSPASADQTATLNFGPAGYDVTNAPPSGSLTLGGGGKQTAQCSSSAAIGKPGIFTPACTTRKVTCPVTASYCGVVYQAQEFAPVGPVWAYISFYLTGGSYGSTVVKPYNCPQSNSCGLRYIYYVTPGSVAWISVNNVVFAPRYPTVTANVASTPY